MPKAKPLSEEGLAQKTLKLDLLHLLLIDYSTVIILFWNGMLVDGFEVKSPNKKVLNLN